MAQHQADYEALRRTHATPRLSTISLQEARTRRTPIEWRAEDIPEPSFAGVRVLDNFPLAEPRCGIEFIDWSGLFHTWGLKGVYPRILEHEKYGVQATQLFRDANALLDVIIEGNLLTARGVYGLFPASAVGDDVELYGDDSRRNVLEKLHFLRQQAHKEGTEPCRSLADFYRAEAKPACRII